MALEEIRGSLGCGNDKFPVGMRVLAVDDDTTCLRVLDGLLRKCQYQVTTTSHAKTALKMLRENRNRFDLIISDVHMPDMDGFKLLELVGLEMDLPVIMLSANSDPKLVMKGITHGACDYLVKPVRIEELRNIWQHVIRRKKFDSKNENSSTTQDRGHRGNGDGGQGPSPTGHRNDQNGKPSRKRKDEEEEEEEDGEENGHENEDPATQKKPRVVWSIELHRKFVAAVNQLGIEKAVPKRILDMMNVEGLTRENVASHLQKYRLYLKRISSGATQQQANMVAALCGKDSSYMRMSSLDGLGDFQTFAGPGRFSNTGILSYQAGGILSRLNSPSGMNLRSLSSSALIQPNHAQNLSNSISTLGKFQPVVSPPNQNAGLFQGIPTSLELDQLQPSKCDDPTIFTSAVTFADNRAKVGSSSNSLILQGNPQHIQNGGVFSNQSSLKAGSLNLEPFNTGISGSNFLDSGRCNENWHSTIQLPNLPSNPLSLSETLNHDRLLSNSIRSNNSLTGTPIQNSPLDFSSISAPMEDSREIHCQARLVGGVVPNINQATDKRWGEHKQDYAQSSNHFFTTLNSMVPASGVVTLLSQSLDQNAGAFRRKTDTSSFSQSNGNGASTFVQHCGMEKSVVDSRMRSNEDYNLEHAKSQGGFVHNGYDSLDALMTGMTKQEQEGAMSMDGEFGFDAYTFGSSL